MRRWAYLMNPAGTIFIWPRFRINKYFCIIS